MIYIEDLEEFLWESFGKSHYASSESGTAINIQDLAPDLGDFLHGRGVKIDWRDGSAYGTKDAIEFRQ